MTRLSTFFSILCVVLAGTMSLLLCPLHPGWAVRLTRYVSQSMVGGRRSSTRRVPGGSRRLSRRLPASKPVTVHRPVDSTQDNTQEVQSALVNLGMKRAQAAQLAKQAVQGRDFDSAIRWAIAQAA